MNRPHPAFAWIFGPRTGHWVWLFRNGQHVFLHRKPSLTSAQPNNKTQTMNKINDQILEKWQRPDEEILRTRGFPNLLKLFETLPSPIIKYINDDIMEDTGGDLLKHSFLSIRGCVVR